jgi:hypothetical protein
MRTQGGMRSFFLDVVLLSGIITSYLPPDNGLGKLPGIVKLSKVFRN